ncbi:MAG: hypothetical protein K8F53_09785, partial [Rhodocyclaceae bacterium]|nr:hypothetical protein [Rhodocyclaceae bacterium]
QAYRSSLHMLLPSTVRWLMNRFQLGTHDAASEVGGAHTIIPAKAGIHSYLNVKRYKANGNAARRSRFYL